MPGARFFCPDRQGTEPDRPLDRLLRLEGSGQQYHPGPPGEVFTHRNVANIVATNDWNLSAVLEFSINHLKIPDIVICGHYGCGGIEALNHVSRNDQYIPVWLINARKAKERVDQRLIDAELELDHEARMKLYVEKMSACNSSTCGNTPSCRKPCSKASWRFTAGSTTWRAAKSTSSTADAT